VGKRGKSLQSPSRRKKYIRERENRRKEPKKEIVIGGGGMSCGYTVKGLLKKEESVCRHEQKLFVFLRGGASWEKSNALIRTGGF